MSAKSPPGWTVPALLLSWHARAFGREMMVIIYAGVGSFLIIIFVLVAGLVLLWLRGPRHLEAWTQFVYVVLRGNRPNS
jgi:hypothetical protein